MKPPTIKLGKFIIKYKQIIDNSPENQWENKYYVIKSAEENCEVKIPDGSKIFQIFVSGIIHIHQDKVERKDMQRRYEQFCSRVETKRRWFNRFI